MSTKDVKKQSKKLGFIFLFLSTVLWGILAVLDKYIAISPGNPLMISAGQAFFACIIIFIGLTIKDRGLPVNIKYENNDLFLMILIGIIASGLVILFRFLGLEDSSATFAALNQGAAVIMTAVFSYFLLRERLPWVFLPVFLIMVLGTYLVAIGELRITTLQMGDIYLLVSAGLLGFTNTLAKKVMKSVPSMEVVLLRFLFGSIFLLLIVVATGSFQLTSDIWWVALSGSFTGLFVWLGYEGMKIVGASIGASFLMLSPIISAILAYFFLEENLNTIQFVGMIVVILGGLLISQLKTRYKD